MKNLFNIFPKSCAIFSLLLLASSCNKFLEKYPNNSVTTDNAIIDYQSLSVALNGTYKLLQGNSSIATQGFWYYGSRFWVFGDVLGDFMQPTFADVRSARMYQMAWDASNAPSLWNIPYSVIRSANNIIEAIDKGKIKDATPVDLADARGQALAIRALAHFDLCRLYGAPYIRDNGNAANGGIPIITSPISANVKLGRNTVAEVYKQVIKDLKSATEDINSKLKPNKNNGKINLWAAKGLLSRVYLYRGSQADDSASLSLAEEVMASPYYGLFSSSEYLSSWGTIGAKEFLFELISTSSNNIGSECLENLLSEKGFNDYVLTKSFIDIMNQRPDDIRWGLMSSSTLEANRLRFGDNKVYLDKKYLAHDGILTNHSVYVIRMSEIYLNASEAAFKLGNISKAKKYLNAIYLRANPNADALQDSDITLDRILLERGIELIGEGQRFFDLMRNNKDVVRYTSENNRGWHLTLIPQSQKYDNSYFRTVLPIPQTECDNNEVIRDQQNNGY